MSKSVSTKLYVGNLPETCRKLELQKLFEQYGTVVECDIVKNYGFVHYQDPDEAAAAAEALDNRQFEGVNLKVEVSCYPSYHIAKYGRSLVWVVKESVTDVVKRVTGLKTAPRDQVGHRGIVSQVVAEIPTLEIHMITTETDMPLYQWTDSDPTQIPMTEDHLHHHPGTPTTETEILTQDHHQSTTEEQGTPTMITMRGEVVESFQDTDCLLDDGNSAHGDTKQDFQCVCEDLGFRETAE